MKSKFSLPKSAVRLVWTGIVISAAAPLPAATLQWDTVPNDSAVTGGAGEWNATNSNWTVNGATNVTWPPTGADNDANFSAPGGVITIGAGGISANDLTFAATGYTLTGGPLTLTGSLAGNALVANKSVTAVFDVDVDATAGGGNFTGFGNFDYSGAYNGAGKQFTVSGLARFTLSGGSLGAGRFVIGSGGGSPYEAQFILNAGDVSVSGDVAFGYYANAKAFLKGGTFANQAGSSGFFIGNGADIASEVTIDGADVAVKSGNLNIGSGFDGAQTDANLHGTLTLKSGSLAFQSGGAIRISNAATQVGTLNLNGGVFELNGAGILRGVAAAGTAIVSFDGGTLRLAATNANIFGAGVNPTIQAGGAIIDTNGFDGSISTNLVGGAGAGAFAKQGAGKLTLSGLSTYSGPTLVNGGRLALANPSLADDSLVSVAAGAVLELQFAATDVVGSLSINGSSAAAGTWGAVGSGADHETASIVGAGLLNVIGAAATPFESFVASHSLGGSDALPEADPDGDGASNLLEFALHGDPTSSSDQGFSQAVIQDASAPAGSELTLVLAARKNAVFVSGPANSQTAQVDGVRYRVEGATDLAAFQSAVSFISASETLAGHPSLAGTDWKYFTFKLDSSEGLSGNGFLRAVVSPSG